MVDEGLYKWLLQDTALQAVLPQTNAIFMGFVPESANFPCIMFKKVSSVNDTTFAGPSGYMIRRYQFNCYGQDAQNAPGSGSVSAKKVADVLVQELDGFSGALPDGSVIHTTILDNELDDYTDDQTYIEVRDFFIHFPRF